MHTFSLFSVAFYYLASNEKSTEELNERSKQLTQVDIIFILSSPFTSFRPAAYQRHGFHSHHQKMNEKRRENGDERERRETTSKTERE